ncbi:PD-(D/E)XK nuclease family transposase [Enterococcus sp. 669A]|uniref:PD-(D/E)XK nuclease family transposase n=1 Tax=Candidatus Enterococcus moelleringii TaxID=2815325 RepID=A0ABS3L8N9_9ENTE|nr:PD-(D/E)XK nuclease family transposase [Enterococcus sp. 669A]MBO1305996.1 PD-(D/E)XK nuclease family transposase [Enterococcus sp. 669A]
MEYYSPVNDLMLKKILTSEEDAHEILTAFVNDLLGKDFKKVTPMSYYHIDGYKKNQEMTGFTVPEGDIWAMTEEGSVITIDFQRWYHDYSVERAYKYLIEAFCELPLSDQELFGEKLLATPRPTYRIVMLNFDLFESEDKALRAFDLRNEVTYEAYPGPRGENPLNLCFFSLRNDNIEKGSAAHYWQYFFKTGKLFDDDAPAYIKDAHLKIQFSFQTEEEIQTIMQIEKAIEIRDAETVTAEILGEEKGAKKKGKAIAKRMVKKMYDVETIVELTGLSKKKVEEIMEDLS